ncbi:hypothetical protein ACFQ5M_07800 [Agrilactobacillus yilanensis]|uniref:Uncharacterized protein n=1 Tax=Agrilactobacillus yilanensis TaxID=2485997 RepID=A0ABW4J8K4_9LACO|nr:hypothetical protein [Agrilactobacillus yilanensis]
MKKHRKLILILSTIFLSLVLILSLGYAFRRPILKQAQHFLTAQTIPFNWVVDPDKVENGLEVPAVDLSVSQMDTVKKNALKLVTNLNDNFSGKQSDYLFLTTKQAKQLDDWVHDKPHQYIYSITPVSFGKNARGNYVLVSANRYDDTKTIVSYRYRVFYTKNLIVKPNKTQYVATVKNNVPPKFLFEDASVGTDGISTATNFTERIKNALGDGNTYTANSSLKQFKGLAQEMNLSVASAQALQKYLKVSDTDFQNTVITGYELTDVPRVTRFFIVSGTNKQKAYFTLTYDRTQEGFISFEEGIQDATTQK